MFSRLQCYLKLQTPISRREIQYDLNASCFLPAPAPQGRLQSGRSTLLLRCCNPKSRTTLSGYVTVFRGKDNTGSQLLVVSSHRAANRGSSACPLFLFDQTTLISFTFTSLSTSTPNPSIHLIHSSCNGFPPLHPFFVVWLFLPPHPTVFILAFHRLPDPSHAVEIYTPSERLEPASAVEIYAPSERLESACALSYTDRPLLRTSSEP